MIIEDIPVLTQILTNMKDALRELELAVKKKDAVKLNEAKAKMLNLRLQIDRKI